MKFYVSQTENQFSFTLATNKGKTLAVSKIFPNQEDCIAAIRTLTTVLSDSNAYNLSGNKYSISANNSILAESTQYTSNAAAQGGMQALIDDASDEAEYTVEVTTISESLQSKFVEVPSLTNIDYSSLYDFTLKSELQKAGLEPLEIDSNSYSFLYNDATGKELLYSRSFTSERRRDKRIRQVIAACKKEERFEIIEAGGGSYYFIIKARNQAEIARSRMFTSNSAAETGIVYVKDTLPKYKEQYPEPARRKKRGNKYNFDIKGTTSEIGFEKAKDADKNYYFIFQDKTGNPIFYSQGYSGKSGRDNGIKTVIKNANMVDQHEIKEENGKFYFILRAGNRQEIARSAKFNSKEEAEKKIDFTLTSVQEFAGKYGVVIEETVIESETNSFVINVDLPATETENNSNEDEYLDCDAYLNHEETPAEGFRTFKTADEYYFVMLDNKDEVLLRSEGYPTVGARDNGLTSVQKNRELTERYSFVEDSGEHFVVLKAGNHKEIARSCPYESEAAASGKFAFLAGAGLFPWLAESNRNEDEYLDCDAYLNHEETPAEGFRTFKTADEYYFVMLDNKGEVLLRSEGYPTVGARDNGLASVQKNRELTERYSFVEDSGEHFVVLKAGNHKEIARSCPYESEAALLALFPFLGKGSKTAFPWEIVGLTGAAAIAPVILPNKDVTSNELSSESKVSGAAAAIAGAAALSGHSTDHDTEKTAKPVTEKSKAVAPLAAAAALTAAAPVAAATAHNKASKVEDVPVAAVATTAGSGGSFLGIPRWLLALLAAILLALLLWWLLRGCSSSPNEIPIGTGEAPVGIIAADSLDNEKAEPIIEEIPIEAKVEQAVLEPAVTTENLANSSEVIGGVDCGCDTGKEPLFMRYSYKPKTLTKLGSNTEFGNSHALSPSEFYNKLNTAYKTNDVDRVFLDRIFRSMGYRAGWSAANASMFSNTTVPYGTVGNIGYGKDHRTQYSTLNLGNYDQQAFLIKSRNGCDVRFMKTCGNHMFYCTK